MEHLLQTHITTRAQHQLSPYDVSILYAPEKDAFHLCDNVFSRFEAITAYQECACNLLRSKCFSSETRLFLKKELPYLVKRMQKSCKATSSGHCIGIDVPIELNRQQERYILNIHRVCIEHNQYYFIRLHHLLVGDNAIHCKALLYNKLEIGQHNIMVSKTNGKCKITLHELEIMFYISNGIKAGHIAQIMNIHTCTIEATLYHMRHKLECYTTPHLVQVLNIYGLLSCELL